MKRNKWNVVVSVSTLLVFLILWGWIRKHAIPTFTYPSAKDVVGLTETDLHAKYPEFVKPDQSFDLLASKSLYPYKVPRSHVLLRFGKTYLVVEIKDGQVIALHQISG